jgi:hypothetical protein
MQKNITIPETLSNPTLSEEMLHELSLLTPEDAALFRQIKCPACRCSKLDLNPNCNHDPKSPALLRRIRRFRLYPALEALP